MKRIICAALLTVGCAAPVPPAAPVPRTGTVVAASFDKTWGAVIDVFASKNIPIRTIDKASGFIATEGLSVGAEGSAWADCGSRMGVAQRPTQATYNVRVKGDASRSTVQMNVIWRNIYPASMAAASYDCSTKGVWESAAESDVKQRAESR